MEAGKFDDIRSYYDAEIPEVIDRLVSNRHFRVWLRQLVPGKDIDALLLRMRQIDTVDAFQREMVYPVIRALVKKTTTALDLSGFKYIDKTKAYTYISNHRDIVLDSSFLDILLLEKGINTFEIAIGDNLLISSWIKDLVRLNKSFIVKRNLPVRQQLTASMELSSYIYDTVLNRNQSIWIAQREGRAKDSNDRTQISVLKMLNLGGAGSVLENLASLRLVPVSISYEYDPCDFLKAQEMQCKRDNPEYKKTAADDLLNMKTGLTGFKGRVFFKITPCIAEDLLAMEPDVSHRNEWFEKIAHLIDTRIHQNYHLYPGNYIAADLLEGVDRFTDCYSEEEKEQFSAYIQQQLDKIELDQKDEPFLRRKMLEMYANPLKNKLEAEKKPI
jgi:hypothetical protein